MVAAWLFSLRGGPAPPLAGYTAVSGGSPTHRRRGLSRWKAHFAVSAILVALFLLNNGTLMPENPALVEWTLKGCPVKILDLTTTMEATYQVRRRGGTLCCLLVLAGKNVFVFVVAASISWVQTERAVTGRPASGNNRAVRGGGR
jgi:hypothetical protein